MKVTYSFFQEIASANTRGKKRLSVTKYNPMKVHTNYLVKSFVPTGRQ